MNHARRWSAVYRKPSFWQADDSDFRPQGKPESELSYGHESHLGLVVRGQFVHVLGMLAVRCEMHSNGDLVPLGLAIAETPPVPIYINTHRPMQSNPVRFCADYDIDPEGDGA